MKKYLSEQEKRIPLVNLVTAGLLLIFFALMFLKEYTFTADGKTYTLSLFEYLMFPVKYDPSNAIYSGIPFKTYLEDTLTRYSSLIGTADWINTVVRVPAWMFFSGTVGAVLAIIFRKNIGGTVLPTIWCLFGLIGYPMSQYLQLGKFFALRCVFVVVISIIIFANWVLYFKEQHAKKVEAKRLDAERDARWAEDRRRAAEEKAASDAQ